MAFENDTAQSGHKIQKDKHKAHRQCLVKGQIGLIADGARPLRHLVRLHVRHIGPADRDRGNGQLGERPVCRCRRTRSW